MGALVRARPGAGDQPGGRSADVGGGAALRVGELPEADAVQMLLGTGPDGGRRE